MNRLDLRGSWDFKLDDEKIGITEKYFEIPFDDTIILPTTTAEAKKGKINPTKELGYLTEVFKFKGYAWFSKEIDIPLSLDGKHIELYLERTRLTTLWIDGVKIGIQTSICSPHLYNVSDFLTVGKHRITIMVSNTDYITKGGHMTSPDTQTNWNGITGAIELRIFDKAFISNIKAFPNIKNKSVVIKATLNKEISCQIFISAESFNGNTIHTVSEKQFDFTEKKEIELEYILGDNALLWDEYEPNLYKLTVKMISGNFVDEQTIQFGLREFKTAVDKFTINGQKTFLRGKHDGCIFPITGYAPTDVNEWLRVMKIAKEYGINHYRFHTCCPPDAAFEAADILGIYMQPELPFWGTVTVPEDKNHDQIQQDYLINEGILILEAFGNHPSFVMMSLGNELWGNQEKLNSILKLYKELDNRHLYTQGSNNFQFNPVVFEHDDFFSGVRLSKERLIRGSYCQCDAPLGHVQTDAPSAMVDYDEEIGEVTVPIVTHEIGQYETFPNFDEIKKYTGVCEARNFEVFKERLDAKGLGDLSAKYFKSSGALAVECYKLELEAAFRTKKLAGFQILDIQDFSGQGTALVGILDAFMDSKGIVSPEEWRSFCSDAVLLPRFEKFNFEEEEKFSCDVEIVYYRRKCLKSPIMDWSLSENGVELFGGSLKTLDINPCENTMLGKIEFVMPKANEVKSAKKLTFKVEIKGTDIYKSYDLWVYPSIKITKEVRKICVYKTLNKTVLQKLQNGENIVLFPNINKIKNSIEGLYCTDFWCYPMFRSISESVKKKVPVGTMGLLCDNKHPALKSFNCEEYSTPQWFNIVMNSRSIILDDTKKELRPIVQVIDNFERNHKLSILFECKVLNANLLVCSTNFKNIQNNIEVNQFLNSIMEYASSSDFKPDVELSVEELAKLLK